MCDVIALTLFCESFFFVSQCDFLFPRLLAWGAWTGDRWHYERLWPPHTTEPQIWLSLSYATVSSRSGLGDCQHVTGHLHRRTRDDRTEQLVQVVNTFTISAENSHFFFFLPPENLFGLISSVKSFRCILVGQKVLLLVFRHARKWSFTWYYSSFYALISQKNIQLCRSFLSYFFRSLFL